MNIKQQRKAFDEWYSYKYSKAVSEANKEMAWQGWLAARKQEGYVMVPVEPSKEELKEIEEKCFEHPDCFGIDCPLDVIYRAIVGEMG